MPKNTFAQQEYRQLNNYTQNQESNIEELTQKKHQKKPKNPLAYQVLGPPPPKVA